MKLLLVDDEEYVIESIKRNLDLTETGVNEVYTAFSVQQAKNIMEMVDIDIVISDIVCRAERDSTLWSGSGKRS